MNEPSQIDIAKLLLGDDRAEVRVMAARLLIDTEDPRAEFLLAKLVCDPDPTVAECGINTILQRNPWLKLKPFFVRDLPSVARESWQGRRWEALCEGFRTQLEKQLPDVDSEQVARWLKIPGFLPELVESVERLGLSDLGPELAEAGDLYGSAPASQGHVLLAPTYGCNIDCSYCYAKEWSKQSPAHLPREDFDVLFEWLKGNGLNHINLCGGEPTTYDYLDEFLERAGTEGVRVSITTNGLFGRRIGDLLHRYPVEEMTGHYDQEIMQTSPGAADSFQNNLRTAQQAGSKVFLRYTLTAASNREEWTPLLNMATDLNIPVIHYGVAFGNMEGTNTFYDFRFGEFDAKFESQFVGFVEDCRALGLRLHQCKPIPLCVFSPPTLTRLLLEGILRASCAAYLSDCTRNLTINPDLSTFPCNAIGVKGPSIRRFRQLTEVATHFRPLVTELLQRSFSHSCEECFHFYRGFCQGVCMAQHYSSVKAELH